MRLQHSSSPLRPTRRGVLAAGGALLAVSPRALATAAAGTPQLPGHTVVMVALRGGLDGIAAVAPRFEAPRLQALRPDLLTPLGPAGGALELDGDFVLHPELAALGPAWDAGQLAVVHAAGFEDPSRSHFAARELIEAGAPGALGRAQVSGWITRALERAPWGGGAPTGAPRAISLGATLPRALRGAARALPVNEPSNFAAYGSSQTLARRRVALQLMARGAQPAAAGTPRQLLGDAGRVTLGALDVIGSIDFVRPGQGGGYPPSTFGRRLRDAASILLGGAAPQVIHLDTAGDWDDHDDMGPNGSGDLARRLRDLAEGLAAFRADLGATAFRSVTVVVTSEFGRRVDQNGSRGTDHGRAGVAFVLGGAVDGGRVVCDWPGLGSAELEGGALRVTTDLRDIFAEVVQRRLGVGDLAGVFPGHGHVSAGLLVS